MEIEVKCRLEEKQLEVIRKYAKLMEQTDEREVYTFMNVKAVVEKMVATISMSIKSEKDAPKAEKKLMSMINRFGLELC